MKDTLNKVRAIIISDGEVLIMRPNQQNKDFDDSVCFFPGGHIKEGESSLDALLRELKEEVSGLPEPLTSDILGVLEVKWVQNGSVNTEANFVYELTFQTPICKHDVRSTIEYMTCEWVSVDDITFNKVNILPQQMATSLSGWINIPVDIRATLITKEGF